MPSRLSAEDLFINIVLLRDFLPISGTSHTSAHFYLIFSSPVEQDRNTGAELSCDGPKDNLLHIRSPGLRMSQIGMALGAGPRLADGERDPGAFPN
jgi:hypothetical protein